MEEEAKQIVFILGDTLPTNYDVALSIVQVCPRKQGDKAKSTLNAYYAALMRQWTAAFGEGHTLSRKSVMTRLEKVRDSYHNEVYLPCSRKTPKKINQPIPTIRRQNKVWRDKVINKDGDTNACLFDIGVEMETLDGAERVFYDDQKTVRRFRLSQEVDEEYVKQKEDEWLRYKEQMEQEQIELEAMEDDTVDSECENMDISVSFQN